MIPTIEWQNGIVRMIDQRYLPRRMQFYNCRNYHDVIKAIQKMVIRGAPAIGIAAAMGMALAAASSKAKLASTLIKNLEQAGEKMKSARPTAVNLAWAVDIMLDIARASHHLSCDLIKENLQDKAISILNDDIAINQSMGKNGAGLMPKQGGVLTHCNAGALATGGYGTALGVIRAAWEAGKRPHVYADETRPFLQGLRLTAWELMEDNIPVTVIADNSAGFLMQKGMIQCVIVGADRIAANGDVANKIGTYQTAVLAKENNIPFYVAAPLSTIDMSLPSGNNISIENRDPKEITTIAGKLFAPENTIAMNIAFDITPNRYITGIITEKCVAKMPYTESLRSLF